MRYISTRGEAPALGFCDVMLTGLARDGGLYVPETWPQLDAADDRRLLRPALPGSRRRGHPPVRRRRDFRRRPRRAWRTRPTPPSAIRRWCRSTRLSPNQFILELFHGPTLAFKDVAMQLLSRLMDHVLAKRGERTTIVVATSGDTGGAAVDAFRRPRQCRSVRAVSARAHLRRAAADDDHGGRRQCACARGRRHVRRLPGAGEGAVQPSSLPRRVSLSGVNSINWARIVAQAVYYFTSAVALGAPARSVDFTVPTGNFGDIFAGYVAKRMGLPIGRLRVATNVNDILARTLASGAYEVREVHETTSPSMDIQVSSNFERLVFEATDRDSADRARPDGVARAVRPLRACRPAALRSIREQFDAGRADEDEVNAAIRAAWRESGDLIDPHTAVAVAVSEHATRDAERSEHRAVHRACGKISRCGGSGLRCAAGAAGLSRRTDDEARKDHADAERSRRARAFHPLGEPGRQRTCVKIERVA